MPTEYLNIFEEKISFQLVLGEKVNALNYQEKASRICLEYVSSSLYPRTKDSFSLVCCLHMSEDTVKFRK